MVTARRPAGRTVTPLLRDGGAWLYHVAGHVPRATIRRTERRAMTGSGSPPAPRGAESRTGAGFTRRQVATLGVAPAVAAMVGVAGCGADEASPASKVTSAITITYGNDWSSGPRGEIMKQALA